MKLVSVQVGRPRRVGWHGKLISTGIYKEPVAGRIMLHRFNLDGDQQADLTVHGGPDKAVYVYPSEHYPIWQAEFPDLHLKLLPRSRVQISIVQDRVVPWCTARDVPRSKIRHQPVIKPLKDCSLNNRPYSTQKKSVVAALVTRKKSPVGLDVAMHIHEKI